MVNKTKLKNGLTLLTIDLPHLESVTTLLAVGVGSRYENKKISGLSHFLEHMFFKGSKKYPSTQIISNLIDGIGAVNNAGTDREVTFYWIKSAANHLDLASDILSSQLKESLFDPSEIEREKGVIVEEIRMYKDNPMRYSLQLFESLLYGNQPLGWDIAGEEKTVTSFKRINFTDYVDKYYTADNMALVFAGKLPKNIKELANKYFADLPVGKTTKFSPFKKEKQNKPKVAVHYRQTDQVNLVLGCLNYDRYDKRRYAAKLLSSILGEGMSSRLFIEIRERRGLAYSVHSYSEPLKDTGLFAIYAGLKLEKAVEGVQVMLAELDRLTREKVSDEELKKAKEMEKGHLALRSEGTNFLAEHFGVEYVLDRRVEEFDQYLKNIDKVTAGEIMAVAAELFQKNRLVLQVVGPFKSDSSFKSVF